MSTLLAGQEDTTTEEGKPPEAPRRRRVRSAEGQPPEVDPMDPTPSSDELAAEATRTALGRFENEDAGDGETGREGYGIEGPLTQTGILVGTPMYMAPELSEGSHLARTPSDIFSLGVIAYELYTGEMPFSRPAVWARWRGTEVAAPSLLVKRPELPKDLVALIDSCLHLDPSQRPSADAVAAGLRTFDKLK